MPLRFVLNCFWLLLSSLLNLVPYFLQTVPHFLFSTATLEKEVFSGGDLKGVMDMRGVKTEDWALWGGGGRAEGEWRGEEGDPQKACVEMSP